MNKNKDYSLIWGGAVIVIFLAVISYSNGGSSDNPRFPFDDTSQGDAIDYMEGQTEADKYNNSFDECALHPERCQDSHILPVECEPPVGQEQDWNPPSGCYDTSTNYSKLPSNTPSTLAIVTAKGLNIRSGPGTDYADIGDLRLCDTVVVIGQEGEWVQIEGGYVHSDYITYDTTYCTSSQPPVSVNPPTIAITSCPNGCITPPSGCNIKGNISINTGENIYHVPGGEFYEATAINPDYGERWFCTEDEALTNGWRRSER